MVFLNPSFLWGLFLVAIPILIHLFNLRRYTTIYFSQVKFLQNISHQSKSKSRIKNLLLLLVRCLVIIFLVLAFAKPVLLSDNQEINRDGKLVVVYIDNSFSMESVGRKGALIEMAKIKALEIVNAYGREAQFALIANEFFIEQQQFVSMEQMSTYISQVESSHLVRTISEVNKQRDILLSDTDGNKSHDLFILSDFQKNSTVLKGFESDSLCKYHLIKFSPVDIQNVWIDSLWFQSPEHYLGKQEHLVVEVVNESGDDLIDIPVSLFINDTLKTSKNISITQGEKTLVELSFIQQTAGEVNAYVELSDYPVTFDNQLFFNYKIKNSTNILIIEDEKKDNYLNSLYKLESNYKVDNVQIKEIPYGQLNTYNLVILNGLENIPSGVSQQLNTFLEGGGSFFVIPATSIDGQSYNELLAANGLRIEPWRSEKGKIVDLNYTHRLLRKTFKEEKSEVALPNYSGFFTFDTHSTSTYESLFDSESGYPLFVHQDHGNGSVFMSAIPFNKKQTNLMYHPLIVPLCYNIAMQSGSYGQLYHMLEPQLTVEVSVGKESVKTPVLYEKSTGEHQQPSYRMYRGDLQLFLEPEYLNEGFFDLQINENYRAGLSFNNSRTESDLSLYSKAETKELFKNAGIQSLTMIDGDEKHLMQKVKQLNEGKPLSRLIVIFVVLLLMAEAIVIRFMK